MSTSFDDAEVHSDAPSPTLVRVGEDSASVSDEDAPTVSEDVLFDLDEEDGLSLCRIHHF
jgi:hypothetical protein